MPSTNWLQMLLLSLLARTNAVRWMLKLQHVTRGSLHKGNSSNRDSGQIKGSKKFYCLRQGTSKRGGQSANQSVSQASSQPGSHSGKQAGRQETGRQKHTVWLLFSRELHLQTVGDPICAGPIGDRVMGHSLSASKVVGSNPAGDRRYGAIKPVFFFTRPWFKSF